MSGPRGQLCKCIRGPLRVCWLMSNSPFTCYAFFRLGEYLKRQGTSVSAQHGFCSGYLSSCPPCCLTDGRDSNQDAHHHIKWGYAAGVLQGAAPYTWSCTCLWAQEMYSLLLRISLFAGKLFAGSCVKAHIVEGWKSMTAVKRTHAPLILDHFAYKCNIVKYAHTLLV